MLRLRVGEDDFGMADPSGRGRVWPHVVVHEAIVLVNPSGPSEIADAVGVPAFDPVVLTAVSRDHRLRPRFTEQLRDWLTDPQHPRSAWVLEACRRLVGAWIPLSSADDPLKVVEAAVPLKPRHGVTTLFVESDEFLALALSRQRGQLEVIGARQNGAAARRLLQLLEEARRKGLKVVWVINLETAARRWGPGISAAREFLVAVKNLMEDDHLKFKAFGVALAHPERLNKTDYQWIVARYQNAQTPLMVLGDTGIPQVVGVLQVPQAHDLTGADSDGPEALQGRLRRDSQAAAGKILGAVVLTPAQFAASPTLRGGRTEEIAELLLGPPVAASPRSEDGDEGPRWSAGGLLTPVWLAQQIQEPRPYLAPVQAFIVDFLRLRKAAPWTTGHPSWLVNRVVAHDPVRKFMLRFLWFDSGRGLSKTLILPLPDSRYDLTKPLRFLLALPSGPQAFDIEFAPWNDERRFPNEPGRTLAPLVIVQGPAARPAVWPLNTGVMSWVSFGGGHGYFDQAPTGWMIERGQRRWVAEHRTFSLESGRPMLHFGRDLTREWLWLRVGDGRVQQVRRGQSAWVPMGTAAFQMALEPTGRIKFSGGTFGEETLELWDVDDLRAMERWQLSLDPAASQTMELTLDPKKVALGVSARPPVAPESILATAADLPTLLRDLAEARVVPHSRIPENLGRVAAWLLGISVIVGGGLRGANRLLAEDRQARIAARIRRGETTPVPPPASPPEAGGLEEQGTRWRQIGRALGLTVTTTAAFWGWAQVPGLLLQWSGVLVSPAAVITVVVTTALLASWGGGIAKTFAPKLVERVHHRVRRIGATVAGVGTLAQWIGVLAAVIAAYPVVVTGVTWLGVAGIIVGVAWGLYRYAGELADPSRNSSLVASTLFHAGVVAGLMIWFGNFWPAGGWGALTAIHLFKAVAAYGVAAVIGKLVLSDAVPFFLGGLPHFFEWGFAWFTPDKEAHENRAKADVERLQKLMTDTPLSALAGLGGVWLFAGAPWLLTQLSLTLAQLPTWLFGPRLATVAANVATIAAILQSAPVVNIAAGAVAVAASLWLLATVSKRVAPLFRPRAPPAVAVPPKPAGLEERAARGQAVLDRASGWAEHVVASHRGELGLSGESPTATSGDPTPNLLALDAHLNDLLGKKESSWSRDVRRALITAWLVLRRFPPVPAGGSVVLRGYRKTLEGSRKVVKDVTKQHANGGLRAGGVVMTAEALRLVAEALTKAADEVADPMHWTASHDAAQAAATTMTRLAGQIAAAHDLLNGYAFLAEAVEFILQLDVGAQFGVSDRAPRAPFYATSVHELIEMFRRNPTLHAIYPGIFTLPGWSKDHVTLGLQVLGTPFVFVAQFLEYQISIFVRWLHGRASPDAAALRTYQAFVRSDMEPRFFAYILEVIGRWLKGHLFVYMNAVHGRLFQWEPEPPGLFRLARRAPGGLLTIAERQRASRDPLAQLAGWYQSFPEFTNLLYQVGEQPGITTFHVRRWRDRDDQDKPQGPSNSGIADDVALGLDRNDALDPGLFVIRLTGNMNEVVFHAPYSLEIKDGQIKVGEHPAKYAVHYGPRLAQMPKSFRMGLALSLLHGLYTIEPTVSDGQVVWNGVTPWTRAPAADVVDARQQVETARTARSDIAREAYLHLNDGYRADGHRTPPHAGLEERDAYPDLGPPLGWTPAVWVGWQWRRMIYQVADIISLRLWALDNTPEKQLGFWSRAWREVAKGMYYLDVPLIVGTALWLMSAIGGWGWVAWLACSRRVQDVLFRKLLPVTLWRPRQEPILSSFVYNYDPPSLIRLTEQATGRLAAVPSASRSPAGYVAFLKQGLTALETAGIYDDVIELGRGLSPQRHLQSAVRPEWSWERESIARVKRGFGKIPIGARPAAQYAVLHTLQYQRLAIGHDRELIRALAYGSHDPGAVGQGNRQREFMKFRSHPDHYRLHELLRAMAPVTHDFSQADQNDLVARFDDPRSEFSEFYGRRRSWAWTAPEYPIRISSVARDGLRRWIEQAGKQTPSRMGPTWDWLRESALQPDLDDLNRTLDRRALDLIHRRGHRPQSAGVEEGEPPAARPTLGPFAVWEVSPELYYAAEFHPGGELGRLIGLDWMLYHLSHGLDHIGRPGSVVNRVGRVVNRLLASAAAGAVAYGAVTSLPSLAPLLSTVVGALPVVGGTLAALAVPIAWVAAIGLAVVAAGAGLSAWYSPDGRNGQRLDMWVADARGLSAFGDGVRALSLIPGAFQWLGAQIVWRCPMIGLRAWDRRGVAWARKRLYSRDARLLARRVDPHKDPDMFLGFIHNLDWEFVLGALPPALRIFGLTLFTRSANAWNASPIPAAVALRLAHEPPDARVLSDLNYLKSGRMMTGMLDLGLTFAEDTLLGWMLGDLLFPASPAVSLHREARLLERFLQLRDDQDALLRALQFRKGMGMELANHELLGGKLPQEILDEFGKLSPDAQLEFFLAIMGDLEAYQRNEVSTAGDTGVGLASYLFTHNTAQKLYQRVLGAYAPGEKDSHLWFLVIAMVDQWRGGAIARRLQLMNRQWNPSFKILDGTLADPTVLRHLLHNGQFTDPRIAVAAVWANLPENQPFTQVRHIPYYPVKTIRGPTLVPPSAGGEYQTLNVDSLPQFRAVNHVLRKYRKTELIMASPEVLDQLRVVAKLSPAEADPTAITLPQAIAIEDDVVAPSSTTAQASAATQAQTLEVAETAVTTAAGDLKTFRAQRAEVRAQTQAEETRLIQAQAAAEAAVTTAAGDLKTFRAQRAEVRAQTQAEETRLIQAQAAAEAAVTTAAEALATFHTKYVEARRLAQADEARLAAALAAAQRTATEQAKRLTVAKEAVTAAATALATFQTQQAADQATAAQRVQGLKQKVEVARAADAAAVARRSDDRAGMEERPVPPAPAGFVLVGEAGRAAGVFVQHELPYVIAIATSPDEALQLQAAGVEETQMIVVGAAAGQFRWTAASMDEALAMARGILREWIGAVTAVVHVVTTQSLSRTIDEALRAAGWRSGKIDALLDTVRAKVYA
ncbi:MAG: hypothetical protein HY600_00705 [Candidatus Omnitrophica bacterium]|nr:hypothetical protein [Candidatus Omnitrophota bacterium]